MIRGILTGIALASSMSIAGMATSALAASTADIRQIKFTGYGQSTGGWDDGEPVEIGTPAQVSGLWILKEGIPRVGLYNIFAEKSESRPVEGNAEYFSFRLDGSPLGQANDFDSNSFEFSTTGISATILNGDVIYLRMAAFGSDCGTVHFGWSKGSLGTVSQENFSSCGDREFDSSWTASIQMAPNNPNTFVPEPSTWAMLIVGFGAVGVAARRRRHYNATV